jgi:hypothetical protein
MQFGAKQRGVAMTMISIFSTRSATEAGADYSIKTIALFCCVGLVTSLGLMTFGMDLSAGWL